MKRSRAKSGFIAKHTKKVKIIPTISAVTVETSSIATLASAPPLTFLALWQQHHKAKFIGLPSKFVNYFQMLAESLPENATSLLTTPVVDSKPIVILTQDDHQEIYTWLPIQNIIKTNQPSPTEEMQLSQILTQHEQWIHQDTIIYVIVKATDLGLSSADYYRIPIATIKYLSAEQTQIMRKAELQMLADIYSIKEIEYPNTSSGAHRAGHYEFNAFLNKRALILIIKNNLSEKKHDQTIALDSEVLACYQKIQTFKNTPTQAERFYDVLRQKKLLEKYFTTMGNYDPNKPHYIKHLGSESRLIHNAIKRVTIAEVDDDVSSAIQKNDSRDEKDQSDQLSTAFNSKINVNGAPISLLKSSTIRIKFQHSKNLCKTLFSSSLHRYHTTIIGSSKLMPIHTDTAYSVIAAPRAIATSSSEILPSHNPTGFHIDNNPASPCSVLTRTQLYPASSQNCLLLPVLGIKISNNPQGDIQRDVIIQLVGNMVHGGSMHVLDTRGISDEKALRTHFDSLALSQETIDSLAFRYQAGELPAIYVTAYYSNSATININQLDFSHIAATFNFQSIRLESLKKLAESHSKESYSLVKKNFDKFFTEKLTSNEATFNKVASEKEIDRILKELTQQFEDEVTKKNTHIVFNQNSQSLLTEILILTVKLNLVLDLLSQLMKSHDPTVDIRFSDKKKREYIKKLQNTVENLRYDINNILHEKLGWPLEIPEWMPESFATDSLNNLKEFIDYYCKVLLWINQQLKLTTHDGRSLFHSLSNLYTVAPKKTIPQFKKIFQEYKESVLPLEQSDEWKQLEEWEPSEESELSEDWEPLEELEEAKQSEEAEDSEDWEPVKKRKPLKKSKSTYKKDRSDENNPHFVFWINIISNNHIKIEEYLSDSQNLTVLKKTSLNKKKHTPLTLAAACSGYQITKLLIQHGCFVDETDKNIFYTPLMHAIISKVPDRAIMNHKVIELLLECNTNILYVSCHDNHTALSLAVLTECLPTVVLLTEHLKRCTEDDVEVLTDYLWHALKFTKNQSIIAQINDVLAHLLSKTLIKKSKPESKSESEPEPEPEPEPETKPMRKKQRHQLHKQCKDDLDALFWRHLVKGYSQKIAEYLKNPAHLTILKKTSSKKKHTPLTIAAFHINIQIVELLIQRGCPINATDKKIFYTPLMHVMISKKASSKMSNVIQIIHTLLHQHADVLYTSRYDQHTALSLAVSKEYKAIIILLTGYLKKHINTFETKALNSYLKYALTFTKKPKIIRQINSVLAALTPSSAAVTSPDSKPPHACPEILPSSNSIPLAITSNPIVEPSTTPSPIPPEATSTENLWDLIARGSFNKVKAFLAEFKNEISIILQQRSGLLQQTPLIAATYVCHLRLTKFFLQKGCNTTATDSRGYTALMTLIASKASYERLSKAYEIAELLVKSNNNMLYASPQDQHTALSLAVVTGHIRILELLIKTVVAHSTPQTFSNIFKHLCEINKITKDCRTFALLHHTIINLGGNYLMQSLYPLKKSGDMTITAISSIPRIIDSQTPVTGNITPQTDAKALVTLGTFKAGETLKKNQSTSLTPPFTLNYV